MAGAQTSMLALDFSGLCSRILSFSRAAVTVPWSMGVAAVLLGACFCRSDARHQELFGSLLMLRE